VTLTLTIFAIQIRLLDATSGAELSVLDQSTKQATSRSRIWQTTSMARAKSVLDRCHGKAQYRFHGVIYEESARNHSDIACGHGFCTAEMRHLLDAMEQSRNSTCFAKRSVATQD
jgi:hypothetical protein